MIPFVLVNNKSKSILKNVEFSTLTILIEPCFSSLSKRWSLLTGSIVNTTRHGFFTNLLCSPGSLDSIVERSLRRHLEQPANWDDLLPQVQDTILHAESLYEICNKNSLWIKKVLSTEQSLIKLLKINNQATKWRICSSLIPLMETNTQSSLSKLKGALQRIKKHTDAMQHLVQQVRNSWDVYDMCSRPSQSLAELAACYNKLMISSKEVSEKQLQKSCIAFVPFSSITGKSFPISGFGWCSKNSVEQNYQQNNLEYECYKNEHPFTLLCERLPFLCVRMVRALCFSISQQLSNETKMDQCKKVCIDHIYLAAQEFVDTLQKLTYIEHCNQFSIDELVYGRILPFMWRECNHRRQEQRFRLSLSVGEQTQRQAIRMAFELMHRMLLQVCAIYIITSLDYLMIMEDEIAIQEHMRTLNAYNARLLRHSLIYAHALVERDILLASCARSASCIARTAQEQASSLQLSDIIGSELHAIIALASCVKALHDKYVIIEQFELPTIVVYRSASDGKYISQIHEPPLNRLSLDYGLIADPFLCSSLATHIGMIRAHNRKLICNGELVACICWLGAEQRLLGWLTRSAVHLQQWLLFGAKRLGRIQFLHIDNKINEDFLSDSDEQDDLQGHEGQDDRTIDEQTHDFLSQPRRPEESRTLNEKDEVTAVQEKPVTKHIKWLKRIWRNVQQQPSFSFQQNDLKRELLPLEFFIRRRKQLNARWRKLKDIHRIVLPVQSISILKCKKNSTLTQSHCTFVPLARWMHDLQTLVRANGFCIGAALVMRTYASNLLFWEEDMSIISESVQQFAVAAILKDDLASARKWYDLSAMKTLPPQRHIINQVHKMLNSKPMQIQKTLRNEDAYKIALRLYWNEFASLPDRICRLHLPVKWLDEQINIAEIALAKQKLPVPLECLDSGEIHMDNKFPQIWINDEQIVRKRIIKHVIRYQKNLSQV